MSDLQRKATITDADWTGAAWLLGCDVPAMKAVGIVESGSVGAFLPTGEPVILFERHLFHRLTGGLYSATHPDISNPDPGGYGKTSEQHRRLARAAELNRSAALQSASWGAFQVLASNYQRAGYDSVQAFINAMYRSAADHLRAFACFVRSDSRLEIALRMHDWPAFARWYNGPSYRQNHYDTKLARAYEREVTRAES